MRVCLLLILCLVAIAFTPSLQNNFVDWDDRQNIEENDAFRGLSFGHIRWMFTTTFGGHYQPLTWLSFALDHEVWGLNPTGYHVTNIVLHAVTAVGFFFVAVRLLALGLKPRKGVPVLFGALVAALVFAVHPLRVESVAWATERRDVLSGMWLMLTVVLYLRAVTAVNERAYRTRLGLSLACFVLSLLSKAAGITLPLVLLVIDAYPLRRWGGSSNDVNRAVWRRVLAEKSLFLVPAVLAAGAALLAQGQTGALRSLDEHSIGLRIGQAFHGIMFYVTKTVWPANLSPLYEQDPTARALDWPNVAAAVLVIAVTLLCWLLRRKRPALLAAWGVYIALLLPVLGLAQSGPQVVADRYSYLSCMTWAVLIGAAVALMWVGSRTRGRVVLTTALALVVAALTVAARDQTRVWRDSRTLWTTVIERGGSRGLAHANLAVVLNSAEQYPAACEHAQTALKTLPGNRTAHIALGRCSLALDDLITAERHYETALDIAATMGRVDAATMLGLAIVKTRLGKPDQAERLYRAIVSAEPSTPAWHFNLAGFLASRGRTAEAKECLTQTLQLDPDYADARFRLGVLHAGDLDFERAVATFEEGLDRDPKHALLGAKLAWVLATCPQKRVRDGRRALELATAVVERNPDGAGPIVLEALAAARAETDDFAGAIETLTALLANDAPGLSDMTITRLRQQLAVYRRGEPMRE